MAKRQAGKPKATAAGIDIWCAHEAIIPIIDLKPHPANPNEHPARQISKLAKNISELGWRNPITISKLSGYIIRGHARYQAAQILKLKSVPVDFQDYIDQGEELADMIADNRIPELSVMNPDKIAQIVENLTDDIDFDLELTGYDATEIADMRLNLEQAPEISLEKIEVKAPPKTAWVLIACPMAKFGQIAELIEQIAEMPDVITETVLNDDEPRKQKK